MSFFRKIQSFFKKYLSSYRGKIIIKIITIFGLTFFLLEAGLRISYSLSPQVKYFLYSSRYDLNFSKIKNLADLQKNAPCPLRPLSSVNGFIVNSSGFYTPDYQEEKPKGTLRIGFMGDSFLIGVVPYRQNFVTLFQEKLQTIVKEEKIEIINWGMPCLGPQFEEKILEIEGFENNPDLIVWMFFVGNDFTDELFPGEKLPLANLLNKNIYTLRMIRNTQKAITGIQTKRDVPTKVVYDDQRPTFSKDQFLKIQAEKLTIFSPQTFPHQSWLGIQKTLLDFKKNCDLNNTKCLVVIIPDENQVDGDLLDEVAIFRKISKDDLIIDYPQKLAVDFFQKNNFSYLDLLPIFRQTGKETKLYHSADTHWNIAGNQLAAEEIFNYVKMFLSQELLTK